MRRRDFLGTCANTGAAAAVCSAIRTAQAAAPERPNILWLDAEDLCPDIGCYGNPLVRTPNLDALAAQGVRFANAFTTSPVCSTSRSAIWTGCYQTTIGAHHHRSNRNVPLPGDVRMFSDYLREAGYFIASGSADRPERAGKTDLNFKLDKPFDGTDWRQRAKGQPFFAQVHFHETHRNFKADPEHPVDPENVELPPYYPDHPIARLDWALYLETVQVLDKKVGAVLERLEEDGLADSTVVFFTGDHGRPMVRGKQWLYDGGIHVPLIVRWPGGLDAGTVRGDLVSAIDLAPSWLAIAGVPVPDYAQGRNLFGDAPEHNCIYAARDRCDGTDDRIRCVRTKRFKYLRNFRPQRPYTQWNEYKKRQYPVLTLMEILHERGELTRDQARFMAPYRPPEELYDLEKDPYEVRNLAVSPAHADTLKSMRKDLDRWICETGDKGQIPEDPEAAFEADAVDVRQWEQFCQNMGFSPLEEPQRYLAYWKQRLEETKRGG